MNAEELYVFDEENSRLVDMLRNEWLDASRETLHIWYARFESAAEGPPMTRDDWKVARARLADLRTALAAAVAAEAAVPTWLADCVSYRRPLGPMAEILARAVADLDGKMSLAELMVANHLEREPVRRGRYPRPEPRAVARTARLFWERAKGEPATAGRASDGEPATPFGQFLDRILWSLDMDAKDAARLAAEIVTEIPD